MFLPWNRKEILLKIRINQYLNNTNAKIELPNFPTATTNAHLVKQQFQPIKQPTKPAITSKLDT